MNIGFGSYLRERREQLGLTRQRVADQSGLSYAYVSQLESGKKFRPSWAALQQLAVGMNVDVHELADKAGVAVDGSEAPILLSSGLRKEAEDVGWHANPKYQDSMPASAPRAKAASPSEVQTARSEVLPALRRLLSAYEPGTRLALLHELQAEAIDDLNAPGR